MSINVIQSFILALLLISSISCEPPLANHQSKGTNIICFGDSLTAGYGAERGHDYPSVLRQMSKMPVINAGVSGDTTRDALERLETDVLDKDPKIVIITLGGNDFLKKIPKEETLRNMERIIDRILARGAMVVWAAVKTGMLGDAYIEDYKEIAKRKRIALIPNILKGIFFDPKYKYDQIHPNSEGYKIMAERIYLNIQPFIKTMVGRRRALVGA